MRQVMGASKTASNVRAGDKGERRRRAWVPRWRRSGRVGRHGWARR